MPEVTTLNEALILALTALAVVLNQLGAWGREYLAQRWEERRREENPGHSSPERELLSAIHGLRDQVSALSQQMREMPASYPACNWSPDHAEAFRAASYHAKRNHEILEEMRENQLRGGYECRWKRDEVLRTLGGGGGS